MSGHRHYPNGLGARTSTGLLCGGCGQGMTDEEVREFRRALGAGEVEDPTAGRLGIIGRERAILARLAADLEEAANQEHDVGHEQETKRGATFEVAVRVDGELTGYVVRVTIELLPR